MKFQHVHVHNLRHLVPRWAMDSFALAKQMEAALTELYAVYPHCRPRDANADNLKFWVEVNAHADARSFRIALPDETTNHAGKLILECTSLLGHPCQIELPLNTFLKGHDSSENLYSVYAHSIRTDVPLTYFGITRRPWYERFSEHLNSAKNGSPYLFHRALREHHAIMTVHTVMLAAVDEDTAMHMEEKWVNMFSLYPLGLNMIPGGRAGIRYLHTLGRHEVKGVEARDAALQELSAASSVGGKPNPLCAARWAADNDYVERVICGHSGRLTADQVRTIRQLGAYGKTESDIRAMTGDDNYRQLRNVLRGVTYGRIK